jgi:hypothetical protein
MSVRRRAAGRLGSAGLLVVLAGLATAGAAQAAAKMQFWNLTSNEIDELYLAPAGTDKWGPNQCLNDDDKSVEADERLALKDVAPGQYDVKFHDVKGRSCLLRNVTVKTGGKYAFSIDEKELANCAN